MTITIQTYGSVELHDLSASEGKSVYSVLNGRIYALAQNQGLKNTALLTKNVHVLPYFHGNRSPRYATLLNNLIGYHRADPSLKGMISGLSLDPSIDNLAVIYYATIQALAYGTKHIIDTMNSKVLGL